MTYAVVLSMDAVEDVLRMTMASGSKTEIIAASKQLQDALRSDPSSAGEHLSEGLYYIDREPLRAFFTIDIDQSVVEIVKRQASVTQIDACIHQVDAEEPPSGSG